jgi:pimeloyl-ACP methyl ester carboxylesterase
MCSLPSTQFRRLLESMIQSRIWSAVSRLIAASFGCGALMAGQLAGNWVGGFDGAAVSEPSSFNETEVANLRHSQAWNFIQTKSWYPYVGSLGGKENPFWHFWRLIRDYDPLPALENVRCPVLAVFGERDTYVPVAKSVANWETGLKKAGNADVTIKVFANADHSLLEVKTGGLKEMPRVKGFVPAGFQFQKDWLLRHVRIHP